MRWDWAKISTAVVASLAVTASSQTRQPCAVLRVIDSNSVELRSGATSRLAGVRAFPNSAFNHSQTLAFLDSLLIGKAIELELDENLPEECAYLWRDSVLVNVELLRRGWMQAWEDTARFKYRDIFLAAETTARQNKSGGWKFMAAVDAANAGGADTVYVTKSGKKYHRADCRLLSPNRTALPLSQARVDYNACRLCISSVNSSKEVVSLQPTNKAPIVHCWGKTKKGDRCKREAEAGTKYCWQHRRK